MRTSVMKSQLLTAVKRLQHKNSFAHYITLTEIQSNLFVISTPIIETININIPTIFIMLPYANFTMFIELN